LNVVSGANSTIKNLEQYYLISRKFLVIDFYKLILRVARVNNIIVISNAIKNIKNEKK